MAQPAPPTGWSTAGRSSSTASSWAIRRSPWRRCAEARASAAGSRWPHGRHRRRRDRHPARHAGHLAPRSCPGRAPHVLPPAGAGPRPAFLLTGDTIEAGEIAHLGVFTEVVALPRRSANGRSWWAEKVARMPADGIVMAKEAFRLVEQLQSYAA
ncbi:MAG: hypothetical protein R2695_11245 [Acidimicrobiales bacterium]